MDDTSRRMNSGGPRARGAAQSDIENQTVRGRAVEQTRGYAQDPDHAVEQRTRQIRDEIEETRGEMTETIDAIQEKLSPRNIVANATERVKTATTERVREMADTASETAQQALDYTRDAANSVVGTARQNPIPLVLIGLGAAWWLTNRSRTSSSASDRGLYRRGYERDDESGSRLGASAGRLATRRTNQLQRTTNQLQRTIEQNPLLVGAGALMLGAAFGLAIPETETENEWMGEARDSVVGRARDLARDAANQVQDAASTLADDAMKLTQTPRP
jgi:hypothetical protein